MQTALRNNIPYPYNSLAHVNRHGTRQAQMSSTYICIAFTFYSSPYHISPCTSVLTCSVWHDSASVSISSNVKLCPEGLVASKKPCTTVALYGAGLVVCFDGHWRHPIQCDHRGPRNLIDAVGSVCLLSSVFQYHNDMSY